MVSDVRPTIAAIMPNYNHGALIGRAIASLQQQTRDVDAIIVVDDASTDNSVEIITHLQKLDPRIALLRHESNRGAIAAINTGLNAAENTFVHFAAADDVFRPDLYASTIPLLELNPEAALACGEVATFQIGSRRPLGIRPPASPAFQARHFSAAEAADLLYRIDNFILTAATIFRREYVVSAGGFDQAFKSFADGYLVRRLALTHGFCYVPEILAEWWIDEAGYSRTTARDTARGAALLTTVRGALDSDPAFPSWYSDLFERRWRFATSRILLSDDAPNYAALRSIADGAPLDNAVRLARLMPGPLARWMMLAMLTLKWKPTSLLRLASTLLYRKILR